MSWTVIVLIISALLAVFAVWKEYARNRKANLVLRMIASVLAVIALACIAIPVSYNGNSTGSDEHIAILITPGFKSDSLVKYQNSKVFTADRVLLRAYSKAKLIHLDELRADSPAITQLHVFGYGLNDAELAELGQIPMTFHPTAGPEGFLAANWNQSLKAGETLTVQGKYKNDQSDPVKLILAGLNTCLDTVTVAAKHSANFELNTIPKNAGKSVYHLLAVDGKDTLANEKLPVQIEPVKPLKILMLSASPDFETRFLKNWLSENGFGVAVRSAISKDKFSSEFVNMPPFNIEHLNSDLLNKFDLVIGDLSVLRSESALLKQQVIQKGLGVIIRADTLSKGTSWLQTDFPVEKLNIKNPPPVALVISGKKGKTTVLKIEPDAIKVQAGTQPLASDEKGHIVAGTSLAGEGRLVYTTISNTYNWMLAGSKDDYTAFWTLLISKAARKTQVTEHWTVSPEYPVISQSVKLGLETSSSPNHLSIDNTLMPPAQNASIPFEWDGNYWPYSSGWQPVAQNNGVRSWWYVYGDYDWSELKAAEKIAATSLYAKTYPANIPVTKPIQKNVRIEVPKIYFYLLLLLACTYLWVEGKGLTLPSP